MAATIAINFTPYAVDQTLNKYLVEGTITLSGNYGGGATHGDTLNFSGFDQIKSQSVPTRVEIFEQPAAGTAATGYLFIFCPGTTQANGVLQILGTGTASQDGGNEITEGTAYSGQSPSLNGVVLGFRAEFPCAP